MEIDYTSIFGEGEPYTISGGGQADLWKNIGVAMDNTHHIATCVALNSNNCKDIDADSNTEIS